MTRLYSVRTTEYDHECYVPADAPAAGVIHKAGGREVRVLSEHALKAALEADMRGRGYKDLQYRADCEGATPLQTLYVLAFNCSLRRAMLKAVPRGQPICVENDILRVDVASSARSQLWLVDGKTTEQLVAALADLSDVVDDVLPVVQRAFGPPVATLQRGVRRFCGRRLRLSMPSAPDWPGGIEYIMARRRFELAAGSPPPPPQMEARLKVEKRLLLLATTKGADAARGLMEQMVADAAAAAGDDEVCARPAAIRAAFAANGKALRWASRLGHIPSVRALVAARDQFRDSVSYHTSYRGDAADVKEAVKEAVAWTHYDVARELVDCCTGAEVFVDIYLDGTLQLAKSLLYHNIVDARMALLQFLRQSDRMSPSAVRAATELLLDHGAQIDGRLLEEAVSTGRARLLRDMLSVLRARVTADGALPRLATPRTDARQRSEMPPAACLHRVMLRAVRLPDDADRAGMAHALLQLGGVDAGFCDGEALVEAARRGDDGVVQLLLDYGAPAGCRSGEPLVAAARDGHVKAVRLLLDYGAPAGCRSGEALVAAARNGHDRVVQVLLDRGAPAGCRSGEPLVAAARNGRVAAVRLLLDRGAPAGKRALTALVAAAAGGHADVVHELLLAVAALDPTMPQETRQIIALARGAAYKRGHEHTAAILA
jgi:Ankyrin repeats (3 copies)